MVMAQEGQVARKPPIRPLPGRYPGSSIPLDGCPARVRNDPVTNERILQHGASVS